MDEKKYFNIPKQVKFWDPTQQEYCFGIAYHDVIICSCCGGVFEIRGVIEDAKEDDCEQAIIPMDWVDFSDYIRSDEEEEEEEEETVSNTIGGSILRKMIENYEKGRSDKK